MKYESKSEILLVSIQYGHISRSFGMATTFLQGTAEGTRKRDGQKKRWADNIKDWVCLAKGSWQQNKLRRTTSEFSVVPQRPSMLKPIMPRGLFYLNWTGPFPVKGVSGYFYVIITMFYRHLCIQCKECRPWSDTPFCGVWSGPFLFANVPFMGSQTVINGLRLFGLSVVLWLLAERLFSCFVLFDVLLLFLVVPV